MKTESFEDRIRHRAYQIWEEDGRPQGREHEHWERAVSEIEAEDNAAQAQSKADDPAELDAPPAKPATKPRAAA
jgi:hypothetical protein